MARAFPTALLAALLLGCGSGAGGAPAGQEAERTVTVRIGDGEGQQEVQQPPAPDVAGLDECPDARIRPTEEHEERAEDAVVCLVNAERRRRGLEPLEPNDALAGAAERKASDMASEDYFAHVGPEGRDVVDWVRGTGYLPGSGGYTLGENIGWAPQGSASPAQIVAAWMDSPSHRRNILARDFEDIGVGVVHGAPREGANPGATYAQFFGSQSPPGVE